MTIDQLLIVITGFGSIILVAWYFFGQKNDTAIVAGNTINITVDGGYTPSIIEVKKNQPVTFKFFRKDPSDCLEQLIIPQWNIAKTLPLNKEIEITFTPNAIGEFPFHCGMNMFHGKIIVKN